MIAALAGMEAVMIHAIVQCVPSEHAAGSGEETIPLPYCSEPTSAEAAPANDDADNVEGKQPARSSRRASHRQAMNHGVLRTMTNSSSHYARKSAVCLCG